MHNCTAHKLTFWLIFLNAGCLASEDNSKSNVNLSDIRSPVFGLAFSADGSTLAMAGSSWEEDPHLAGHLIGQGHISTYNLQTKRKIEARKVKSPGSIPQFPAVVVFLSPDGKMLGGGGLDIEFVVDNPEWWCWYYRYDVADGGAFGASSGPILADVGEVRRHRENRRLNRIWQMVQSPDGATVAFTSDQHLVTLDTDYQAAVGKKRFKGPAGVSTCLTYTPDGKTIATGGGPEKLVRLVDVSTPSKMTEAFFLQHDAVVSWVAFTSDGKILAATDDSGVLKLWDIDKRKERHVIKAHEGDIGALAVSSDGKVATGGGSTIKIWDVNTGKELKSLPNQKGRIQALAFTPDGKTLASSACDVGKEGEVRLWDMAKLLEAKPGK